MSEQPSDKQAPVLAVAGICKRFPGVVALDGVALQVYAGEVVALIGENGAGKSTLMKILGGIVEPDAGTIHRDGRPVAIRSVRQAGRLGISLIHQELNVLDNLDIAGNVFLGREPVTGGWLRLIDRRKIHEQTGALLRRLGLDLTSRTPLARLSIAQQQIVEIAKALSLGARILIMDEPTSSLTLAETQRLFTVVRELRGQGVGIIYISHRLSEIAEIADRVVVLRDGRNAGALARGEITHERMVSLMVGRDLSPARAPSSVPRGERYFEVENLRTRRYPRHPVSFYVARGEILSIAGLVGAGRSEIAQALFGVEPALEGSIRLHGRPMDIRRPQDAIAHGIYLIPEDRRRAGVILAQNVRENITLPALSRYASAGLVRSEREREVAEVRCHELKIKTPSVETLVANLSGGNQQKVVLAKWLTLAPKVLIFDEPTRGVDVGAKAEIYAMMRRLADEGIAVMVISSDLEEVLGISDRVAVMHEGRITGILDRSECTEKAIMHMAVGRP